MIHYHIAYVLKHMASARVHDHSECVPVTQVRPLLLCVTFVCWV